MGDWARFKRRQCSPEIMQNGSMVTRSDKPKDFAAARPPSRAQDFSLDPLPVPEAVESDTDTAWGLWESTLQAHDDAGAGANVNAEDPPTFDDTVPSQLSELPPQDPKR